MKPFFTQVYTTNSHLPTKPQNEGTPEVYTKAGEIVNILDTLLSKVDFKTEDPDTREGLMVLQLIYNSANEIYMRVSAADYLRFYDMQVEHAMVIKEHAKNLLMNIHELVNYKVCDDRYETMLEDHIEEFRVLFLEWTKTFDPIRHFGRSLGFLKNLKKIEM